MANLLTQESQKRLRKQNLLKTLLVYEVVLLAAVIIGIVVLVPNFILSQYKYDSTQERLELLNKSLASRDAANLSFLLKDTEEKLQVLIEDQEIQKRYNLITSIAGVGSDGISIQSFNFGSPTEDSIPVVVKGVASTRSDLTGFVENLKAEEMFEDVSLPIGSLAKEEDIGFSLEFRIIFP